MKKLLGIFAFTTLGLGTLAACGESSSKEISYSELKTELRSYESKSAVKGKFKNIKGDEEIGFARKEIDGETAFYTSFSKTDENVRIAVVGDKKTICTNDECTNDISFSPDLFERARAIEIFVDTSNHTEDIYGEELSEKTFVRTSKKVSNQDGVCFAIKDEEEKGIVCFSPKYNMMLSVDSESDNTKLELTDFSTDVDDSAFDIS